MNHAQKNILADVNGEADNIVQTSNCNEDPISNALARDGAAEGTRGPGGTSPHGYLKKQYEVVLEQINEPRPSSRAGQEIEASTPSEGSGLLPVVARALRKDADVAGRLAACPDPHLACLGVRALQPTGDPEPRAQTLRETLITHY